MKIKEINQKVFEPLKILEGIFIAGKPKEDYADGFIKKFDDKGRLISQQTNHSSNNLITEYTYDHTGNLIAEDVYYERPRKIYRQVRYLYDVNHLLLTKKDIMCGDRGGESSYTNYDYDNEGRVIKTAHYPFSKFSYCESFEYDESGAKKVLIQQNRNLEVTKYCEFYLNRNGKVVAEQKRDRLSNSDIIWENIYDNCDRKIEMILLKDGDIHSREFFTYDGQGNLTSREKVMEDTDEVVNQEDYKFEYDELGDWTSRVYYRNGEIKSFIEREVIYY